MTVLAKVFSHLLRKVAWEHRALVNLTLGTILTSLAEASSHLVHKVAWEKLVVLGVTLGATSSIDVKVFSTTRAATLPGLAAAK